MELRSGVKSLNYIRKLLAGDTDNILPFPVQPQKPVPGGRPGIPLPRSTPAEQGVSAAALDTLLRRLAAAPEGGVHTCLVLRGGHVVCEAAFSPYSTHIWHVTHSLCKSITGTAIGMLIDEGTLALNEKLCDIFPERCNLLTGRRMRSITVYHLLTMSSGVSFKEMGAVLDTDWVKGFFESEVTFEPGTAFQYNSMNTYMLSAIVRRKTGIGLTEYLTPRLFEPLGFGDVAWEKCPMGIEKGGWGLYIRLEDAAKVGQLYLNRGLWNGRRLLSQEWVEQATRPHQKNETTGEEYGYQLWPRSADGTFAFNGMFGQYVVMHPQSGMIVALNSGASNLFTESECFTAVLDFLHSALVPDPAPAAGARALSFTLAHLQFGRPVPPLSPASPLPWYRRLARALLGPPAPPRADLPEAAALLAGRRYTFEANRAGILPIMVAAMNDWYPHGVAGVRFEMDGPHTLVLVWESEREPQCIPIGFGSAETCTLDVGGNRFCTAVIGTFTSDEDEQPVLKLAIHLTESSSSRFIKLIFRRDGTLCMKLDESPSMMRAMRSLERSVPDAFRVNLDWFRDLDYLWYRVDKVCCPVLDGKPVSDASA